jgi:hypothetical protein
MKLLALSLAAFSAAMAHGADWITTGGDYSRTHASVSNVEPKRLIKAWASAKPFRHIRIVGDTIFALDNTPGARRMVALEASTGSEKWSRSVGLQFSAPSYLDGLLVYSYGNPSSQRLHVVDATTGRLLAERRNLLLGKGAPLLCKREDGSLDIVHSMMEGTDLFRYDGSSIRDIWSGQRSEGTDVAPSLWDNKVLVAGIGNYLSHDLETGVSEHFHRSPVSGGGGSAAVIDSDRNRFFIRSSYDLDVYHALTAYSYSVASGFRELWQIADLASGAPALGRDGEIYAVFFDGFLRKIDGATGVTLAEVNVGHHGQAVTVTQGLVWARNEQGLGAYSLSDLSLQGSLNESPATFGTTSDLTNVFVSDKYLVSASQASSTTGGIGVYEVTPVAEPLSLLAILAGSALLVPKRCRGK